MSLARKHFQKTMAAAQAATDHDSPVRENANQYELMMAQLHAHTLELKTIQSISSKCEKKAEFLPVYTPYIEGVLNSGTGQSDKVLMTVMLWSIDAGDYDTALNIADYALKHNLSMPDAHQRTTTCVVAEEIADAGLKSTPTHPISLAQLETTYQLLHGADYPDQVKAKLEKALGSAYHKNDQLNQALENYQRALTLDDRCGVKALIKSIEKQLKQNTEDKTS
jgi:tetratricopeptide (TPR) repeat protein